VVPRQGHSISPLRGPFRSTSAANPSWFCTPDIFPLLLMPSFPPLA
jgi:hypothetical protein